MHPLAERFQTPPGEVERFTVPVKAHHCHLRVRRQYRLGVPAESKGRVEMNGTWPAQNWDQKLKAPLKLHGYVRPHR
jgi:hypothetical protein